MHSLLTAVISTFYKSKYNILNNIMFTCSATTTVLECVCKCFPFCCLWWVTNCCNCAICLLRLSMSCFIIYVNSCISTGLSSNKDFRFATIKKWKKPFQAEIKIAIFLVTVQWLNFNQVAQVENKIHIEYCRILMYT